MFRRSSNSLPVLCFVAPVLGAAVLAGCGRTSSPQDVVRQYAAAVGHNDAGAARRLHTDAALADLGETRFAAEFERRVEAGDEYVARLRTAAEQDAALTARLPYGEFDLLELRLEDGQWRIVSGAGNFAGNRTPRETMVALVRALESRDAQAIFQVMPRSYREQLSSDEVASWMELESQSLDETVALLKAHADSPIFEFEGTAILRYGSRQMRFEREDGVWVVADFD